MGRNKLDIQCFCSFDKCITTVCGIAAIVCSVLSTLWCESIKFEPSQPGIPPISFGIWRLQETQLNVNNGSNSTYATETCVVYPSSIEVDAKWKAARAFSVIAPVLGFLALLGINNSRHKHALGIGMATFITLFQGLICLLLKSNACESILVPATGVNATFWQTAYPDSCVLDSGLILSIVASVLWFVTGIICSVQNSDDDDDNNDA